MKVQIEDDSKPVETQQAATTDNDEALQLKCKIALMQELLRSLCS